MVRLRTLAIAALLSHGDALSMTHRFAPLDRRAVLRTVGVGALGGAGLLKPAPSGASVFFDPAMYGDQENRIAAVSSCEGRVREVIAKEPKLAPAFLKLALLDGLSYDTATGKGGPDGSIVAVVLKGGKDLVMTEELGRMQAAAKILVEISNRQRDSTNMKNVDLVDSVTLPDAIALGGAAAVESVGAPPLSVQLGRGEAPTLRKELASGVKGTATQLALLGALTRADRNAVNQESDRAVAEAFKTAGLTDRELTVLLGALLVLEKVEKVPEKNYNKKKGKLRERGKLGRASEFKKLSDSEFESANDDEDDDAYVGPAGERDEGIDIVESFGSRGDQFGGKATNDITAATFNKFFLELEAAKNAKKGVPLKADTIWVERVLVTNPQSTQWVTSYAQSNLKYLKDLRTAYNSVTQLGAKFTGGKYESLLGNKGRKTLANVED